MGIVSTLRSVGYYSVHPNQLRDIIQWSVWHEEVHERKPEKESATLRECFKYLDLTSRSFSSVIKELNPELLVPVALFYLILRGLDTIEDDMTIPLETKEPLLRNFDKIIEQEGWTFTGNGPNEKDRELLVHFDVVITEFILVKPAYKAIIRDITKQMGDGMADYANNAEHNTNGVNTIRDYELYCHYVAGLVGAGLTRLFVESKLANPALLQRPELAEAMGQFLQKTNITRDVKEDFDDGRRFYPKEIWSKHVDKFEDLFDPRNIDAALNCSSEMVLNALHHADECLFFMAGIKDQSVFNFVAIPQSMAIATMEAVFRNPDIFKKNVKITKGDACKLMLKSSQNLRMVCEVFREYARRIQKKNTPKDPNFVEISVACAKIEKFIESIYPSQNPEVQKKLYGDGTLESAEALKVSRQASGNSGKEAVFLFLAVFATIVVIASIMTGIAYLAGARFDLAIPPELWGKFFPNGTGADPAGTAVVPKPGHGEL